VIAMAIEGLRALGLERFQIDLGHPDFFRGLVDEAKTDAAQGRELRAALLARTDRPSSAWWPILRRRRTCATRSWPCRPSSAAKRCSSARRPSRATTGRRGPWRTWPRVYRLLKIYGLAESVLLDLGEVRGFDYYSGTYFEA